MENELLESIRINETVANLIVGGFIKNCNSIFCKQLPIWRQADEPFESYLKKDDIENKDVLTVASSGDFLIYILNNNPKSVSTFDVNIYTKYYQDLKIGAILALDYKEFLDFFYGNNAFNDKSFDKIFKILPREITNFWRTLLNNYNPNTILNSDLFAQTNTSLNKAIKYNEYLKNEKNYLETRKKIYESSYSFHNLNYTNLSSLLKKFDTIFLSNIIDELNFYKSFKKIIESMKLCAYNHCLDGGVIIASTFNDTSLKNEQTSSYEVKVIEDFAAIKVKK